MATRSSFLPPPMSLLVTFLLLPHNNVAAMDPSKGLRMEQDACMCVVEGVERLRTHSMMCRPATSPHVGGFLHLYDTLVVTIGPRSPGNERAATILRDVLRAWHELSQREHHSFRENILFWIVALGSKPSQDVFVAPTGEGVFPRIVIQWEARRMGRTDDMETAMHDLQRDVVDLFLKSPTVTNDQVIECTLRLRLSKSAKATKTLLEYLVKQTRAYEAQRRRSTKLFLWTTIELMGRRYHEGRSQRGLTAIQMPIIEKFCQAVPPSFRVAIYLPTDLIGYRESQGTIARRIFTPFVQQLCGFAPTNMTGRLQVLDLTNAFRSSQNRQDHQPDLTSMCTLLPFTTTLCELRLEITSRHELLWLGYALLHPRLVMTKLRRLALRFCGLMQYGVDFEDWKKLVRSASPLETVKECLTQSSRERGNATDTCAIMIWRTTTITKRTNLLEAPETTATVITPLKTGSRVELCCADLSSADTVPVIVPGYGLGWVLQAHVSSTIESVEYSSSRHVCLTDVRMDETIVWPPEQEFLLRLFGPTLVHFHTEQPKWFQWQDHPRPSFCALLPHLETIDCCQFSSDLAASDFGQLPQLHSLGLRCTGETIAECINWLVRRGSFRTLRNLRLYVRFDGPEDVTGLAKQGKALVDGRRSLRNLTMAMSLSDDPYFQHPGESMVTAELDVPRRKCALLSVPRHFQAIGGEHPFVHFDAYLFSVVFEFAGSSVQCFRFCVVPPRKFGAILPQDELQTISSAVWYDMYA